MGQTQGIPEVPIPLLPECHALGETPEGYSAKDPNCCNCRDKFTCLPAAIEKKLGSDKLDLDQEVLAVVRGTLTYPQAISRMLLRHSMGAAPVPVALRHTTPIVAALPRTKRDWVARPGVLSIEAMRRHLEGSGSHKDKGVRIGQPFALVPSMQLVRRKADGQERVVILRENGFEVAGQLYPSLSTAAIALEKRSVSGNDFFHLRHVQVEIRDSEGKVLVRGRSKSTRLDR